MNVCPTEDIEEKSNFCFERKAIMKKKMFFIACMAVCTVYAVDHEPILHYDFTAPVVQQGGVYKQPDLPSDMKMSSPEQALILAGNRKQKELIIPNSAGLSIADGGTLYALVRFDQDGKKAGQNDAHDMILFKNGSFLFGRACNTLYFNMGRKWDWKITAENIPTGRWTSLAVSVKKNEPRNYTVKLYIDGRKVADKNFRKEADAPNENPVSIGKGWGGPWLFCGLLGKIMIFDQALTDDQIARMSEAEPLLKK